MWGCLIKMFDINTLLSVGGGAVVGAYSLKLCFNFMKERLLKLETKVDNLENSLITLIEVLRK